MYAWGETEALLTQWVSPDFEWPRKGQKQHLGRRRGNFMLLPRTIKHTLCSLIECIFSFPLISWMCLSQGPRESSCFQVKILTSVLPSTQSGPGDTCHQGQQTTPSFSGTSSAPAAPTLWPSWEQKNPVQPHVCLLGKLQRNFGSLMKGIHHRMDDTVCKELGESWTTWPWSYKLLGFLQRGSRLYIASKEVPYLPNCLGM